MGDVMQRNSMMLSTPQVAPISLGQWGLPRPDVSFASPLNTAGGVGIPDLGQGAALQPPQNFLSPTELNALGGGGSWGSMGAWGRSGISGEMGGGGHTDVFDWSGNAGMLGTQRFENRSLKL